MRQDEIDAAARASVTPEMRKELHDAFQHWLNVGRMVDNDLSHGMMLTARQQYAQVAAGCAIELLRALEATERQLEELKTQRGICSCAPIIRRCEICQREVPVGASWVLVADFCGEAHAREWMAQHRIKDPNDV